MARSPQRLRGRKFTVNEERIKQFWDAHPCGEQFVPEDLKGDYRQFFAHYDAHRYALESHIPACLDELDLEGKRVLEIGLGQGTESEQLIRRGALWSGLDLTPESVARVKTRLELHHLPLESLHQGSVLDMPWDDSSFDLVFSHGVLHHVPDIETAQREIHRVLRPGGELVVMLYARRSLNYQISIRLLRRAAVVAAYPFMTTERSDGGMLRAHVKNARDIGLLEYLKIENFLPRNTDGPHNPFSRVYDLDDVRRDFPDFRLVRSHRHFMHAPPLPVHGLPGGSLMGWHLWAHLEPR
jgi:SAM-dependent methyltransferase